MTRIFPSVISNTELAVSESGLAYISSQPGLTVVSVVTVRLVELLTAVDGSFIKIVVPPVPPVVASPALLIVATDGSDELQFTDVVRSFVVLSE